MAFVSPDRRWRITAEQGKYRIYRAVDGAWSWRATCRDAVEVDRQLRALGGPPLADLIED